MTDRMTSGLDAGFIKKSCLVSMNEIEQTLNGKTKPYEKVNRGSPVSTLKSVSINSDTAYCLGNLILATRFRDRLLGFLAKKTEGLCSAYLSLQCHTYFRDEKESRYRIFQ